MQQKAIYNKGKLQTLKTIYSFDFVPITVVNEDT